MSPNVSTINGVGFNQNKSLRTISKAHLENMEYLFYGERVLAKHSLNNPITGLGDPPAYTSDASKEATLLEDANGKPYVEFYNDGYKANVADSPNEFTAIVIGRNWNSSFWSSFGKTVIVNRGDQKAWDISYHNGQIRLGTRETLGAVLVRESFTQPVDEWWFASIRISSSGKELRFNTYESIDTNYTSVKPLDVPLGIFWREDTNNSNRFGRGDIYLGAYTPRRVSDEDLDAIYNMRPS